MSDTKQIDTTTMTRAEKLVIAANFAVETDRSTFSGHNTEFMETIDLVLDGRKGLFDYTDEELEKEIKFYLPIFEGWRKEAEAKAEEFGNEELLDKCRRISRIQSVDEGNRTWELVDPAVQEAWNEEEKEEEKKGE